MKITSTSAARLPQLRCSPLPGAPARLTRASTAGARAGERRKSSQCKQPLRWSGHAFSPASAKQAPSNWPPPGLLWSSTDRCREPSGERYRCSRARAQPSARAYSSRPLTAARRWYIVDPHRDLAEDEEGGWQRAIHVLVELHCHVPRWIIGGVLMPDAA